MTQIVPTTTRPTRTEQAHYWWIAFLILAALSATLAFFAAGDAFATEAMFSGEEEFNPAAGAGAAAAAVMVWLPTIAVFDILRRPR